VKKKLALFVAQDSKSLNHLLKLCKQKLLGYLTVGCIDEKAEVQFSKVSSASLLWVLVETMRVQLSTPTEGVMEFQTMLQVNLKQLMIATTQSAAQQQSKRDALELQKTIIMEFIPLLLAQNRSPSHQIDNSLKAIYSCHDFSYR